jgi:SAM-dependent methyltransferase
MQTPAENHLIRRLCDFLLEHQQESGVAAVLNIGAGQSTIIEGQLIDCGCDFACDRVDVEDCAVEFPAIRSCWQCSVEEMKPLESRQYSAAFANYVLEHVENLEAAAGEIFRVLRPGGLFVAAVPNLTAPEFVIARHAPARLQKAMTGGKGFHVCYAWKTIDDLANIFRKRGFALEEVGYWAFTEGYLWRYPVLKSLSRVYDKMVSGLGLKRLMGNVCITFRKP